MAKAPIAVGALRHRVELQSRSLTPDNGDDYTEGFSTIATVWAAIEAIAGGRVLDGVQDLPVATHRVVVRWRGDQAAWRWLLLGDGRRLLVRSVADPDERGRFLELLCEEEVHP